MKNRIVKVELKLLENEHWQVEVTKEFAPEHGGGSQVFTEPGSPSIHRALEVAREMVTLSPGQRTKEQELSPELQKRYVEGWFK